MMFKTDQEFIEQDDLEDYYYNIENHKYGILVECTKI